MPAIFVSTFFQKKSFGSTEKLPKTPSRLAPLLIRMRLKTLPPKLLPDDIYEVYAATGKA